MLAALAVVQRVLGMEALILVGFVGFVITAVLPLGEFQFRCPFGWKPGPASRRMGFSMVFRLFNGFLMVF